MPLNSAKKRFWFALPELVLRLFIAECAFSSSTHGFACLQSKPDMIAFKERKVELGTPLEVIGQVPGVAVGAKFQNKGELAIMGVHCNITGGIYFK